MVWRLIKLETRNAFMNMAIDEAVLRARVGNRVSNTLRFYCWNPSSVSLGRFQNVEEEVELDHCRKYGVDVVRRVSGGGAVFHDSGNEITYSVVAGKEDLGAQDLMTIYGKIYGGLAEALETLGLEADFDRGNPKNCPNLMIKGRKISGSAQSHKNGVVLQHGTLLVDVDLEKMFTFLRVPWASTCMEVVDVAKRKITSIEKELGRAVSVEDVEKALAEGFQRALDLELVEGGLTPYERQLSEKLYKDKYNTNHWNIYGRSD